MKKSVNKNNKVQLVLIAGGTASGKTTIAENTATRLSKHFGKKTNLVNMDDYYKEAVHWTRKGIKLEDINWDEPSSFDFEYLISDIKKMLAGQTVVKYKFNYNTNAYDTKTKVTYKKADVIILEGIMALYAEELIELASKKVFVDTDADIRFIRRLVRDKQRHNDFEQEHFIKAWIKVLKPMHDKFIEPQKKVANLIVVNNAETVDVSNLDPLNSIADL